MERILVEIESPARAKELMSMLSALNFVKKVSPLKDVAALTATLQEEATSVESAKALAHIKEGLAEGRQILTGQAKPLTREEFKVSLKA